MRKIKKKSFRSLRRMVMVKSRIIRLNRKRTVQNITAQKGEKKLVVIKDNRLRYYHSRLSRNVKRLDF
ncbi:hypothetical protein [Psittacicella hinzii]|uniref:hypothetical protein n=1 Tax=Psittacicella hinzii TaxID=2028575 RepID=UPI000E67E6FB|nr:hypothetical protein [Psittacicella hinzii]